MTYLCSVFDGNIATTDPYIATDGAIVNLMHYGARFDNVTFSNNKGSALQVSCVIVICIMK